MRVVCKREIINRMLRSGTSRAGLGWCGWVVEHVEGVGGIKQVRLSVARLPGGGEGVGEAGLGRSSSNHPSAQSGILCSFCGIQALVGGRAGGEHLGKCRSCLENSLILRRETWKGIRQRGWLVGSRR